MIPLCSLYEWSIGVIEYWKKKKLMNVDHPPARHFAFSVAA
jgi:hypothetical protein